MYRIREDYEHSLEIKKSRFICYLHKCYHEEDAKEFILKIKKLHPDATHHCYAFIIGEHNEIQRSNDDGEPSGTAGMPMLECLAVNKMQDIVAVVLRYFGGIKLGGGGLIRAYSKSVANALQNCVLMKKQKMQEYTLTFSYDMTGKLDQYFRSHHIQILDKKYEEDIIYHFLVQKSIEEDISELTSGRFLPQFVQEHIIEVEKEDSYHDQ